MATTDQVRRWFPHWVLNHADRGKPGFQPQCRTVPSVVIDFPKQGGGVWQLPVHALAAEAFEAYVFLMRLHGVTMSPTGGVHKCRNIAGSNMPSLHAYGVCIDLPPNSYKPGAFMVDVLTIRTKTGEAVWRNLADINDRMHDQIDCSPADLASGIDWTTVAGYTPPNPPTPPEPPMCDLTPPPDALPRPVFDGAWDRFVAAGQPPIQADSRTNNVYREDLAWHFDRYLMPMLRRIDALEARVAELETTPPGSGVTEDRAAAIAAEVAADVVSTSRIVP